MEKKNGKGVKILFVLLVFLVLGMGAYIIYDKFIAKDKDTTETEKQSNETSVKIDDSKDYVYYDSYNSLLTAEGYYGDDNPENDISDLEFLDNDNNIVLKKAVLNIDSKGAKTINNRIEKLFAESQQVMTGTGISECKAGDSEGTIMLKAADGSRKCLGKLDYLTYDVSETDDYISISIIKTEAQLNAGGGQYAEAYTISKKDGNLYTDDKILNGVSEDTIFNAVFKAGTDEFVQESYDLIKGNQINEDYKNRYFYLTSDGDIGVWYITLPGWFDNYVYKK